jgi:hypothetical protein
MPRKKNSTTHKQFDVPMVDVDGVQRPCLTEVDLLRLELAHAQISNAANGARVKALEADQFEAAAIAKVRSLRSDSRALADEHQSLVDEKTRLLNELGEKYKINFKDPELTYNTDTRIIMVPEKPFKREKKEESAN